MDILEAIEKAREESEKQSRETEETRNRIAIKKQAVDECHLQIRDVSSTIKELVQKNARKYPEALELSFKLQFLRDENSEVNKHDLRKVLAVDLSNYREKCK
jgi:hypothetical protein